MLSCAKLRHQLRRAADGNLGDASGARGGAFQVPGGAFAALESVPPALGGGEMVSVCKNLTV